MVGLRCKQSFMISIEVRMSHCSSLIMINAIVWEKFTIGYFCARIVHGKIFSSLGVSDKNVLTMN